MSTTRTMFAPKSLLGLRLGPKKPKPKKKKPVYGGAALSARSGSTGSLPTTTAPLRRLVARQRSQTSEQPRLRRAAPLDRRVRQAGGRAAHRAAPAAGTTGELGDRLPSLRARIAEMRALASMFPDSELSRSSDATVSDTRANIASILKRREYEQNVAKNRRRLVKQPSAPSLQSRRSSHAHSEWSGAGRRPLVARRNRSRSPQPRHPVSRTPRSRVSRSPRSRHSRSPRSRLSRSPHSRLSRSPRSRLSRSPRSRVSRSPRSRVSRSPRSRVSRSPQSRVSRSPRSRDEASRSDHDSRHERPARGVPEREKTRGGDRGGDRGGVRGGDHDSRLEEEALSGGDGEREPQYRPGEKPRSEAHHGAARERVGKRADQQRRQQEEGREPSLPASTHTPETTAAATEPRDDQPKPPLDPAMLMTLPQIPNLSEMVAPPGGGPNNLQDVIRNFMWAKQQASAAASMMSSLRGVIENMAQPAQDGEAAATSPRQRAVAAAASVSCDHQVAGRAAASGSCHSVPGGGRRGAPAAGSWHTVSGSVSGPTVESLLAGPAGAAPLPPPAGEEAQPSARSAGSLPSSAGTTYLQPGDSRSQLNAAGSQLNPAADSSDHEGSEVGSALRSVSEAGLAAGDAEVQPATLDQSDDIAQLRKQYQIQQDKLRQMQQKNYVLSLAVEGQEKTIRTMSNELQDAKEAVSHQTVRRAAVMTSAAEPQYDVMGSAGQQGAATATISTQSWPLASTKTEISQDDGDANRAELERLKTLLESKERELSLLKTNQHNKELKALSAGMTRPLPAVIRFSEHQLQEGVPDSWLSRGLQGVRTRPSELNHALGTDPGPTRRHSFSLPPPRAGETCCGHLAPCQSGAVPGGVPPAGVRDQPGTTLGHRAHGHDSRCLELKATVEESLNRVRELETQLQELRCSRNRPDNAEPSGGVTGGSLPGLGADLGAASSAIPGGGLCKPFPQIVRLTEMKLQQAYQSLLTEQHKNKQLNKQLHELTARLEQHSSQQERLKERLSGSLEERQLLQGRLVAAETTAAEAQRKLEQTREDLHRKTELLAKASQHLEDRIEQVSLLSRELEAVRSEAAHQSRQAAERLAELRTHAAELEASCARLEADNRQLRKDAENAGQLSQSEKRLRQRVLDMQAKLEQSNATAKMLENYVLFLKTSYSKMFGAPSPTPAAGVELPPSVRDLLEQTEAQ